MKYILICFVALAVCIFLGYLLARIVKKVSRRNFGRMGMILVTTGCSIILLIALSLVFFSIHYLPGETALAALNGSDTVTVEKVDGGYFFDGPSDKRAIIFYPGAKVEAKAYAPLMLKLADAGFDCFLSDMPFNFSLFGSNTADKFISSYNYDSWIMAGHSMGGIVASNYAVKHSDAIDGIILLASYSTAQIDDSFLLCSIYGREDGCLDIAQYEKHHSNLPDTSWEYIIDGGNHAQFGDYGTQKGDGTAFITDDEQQNRTVEAILDAFGESEDPTSPVKVILDCDMGYMNDDALCLSMLINAEEQGIVDILGITLEGGNTFIDAPFESYGELQYGSLQYTQELLASLNRSDIPCYIGTDFPIGMDKSNIQELDAFYRGLNYIKYNDTYGAIHHFASVDSDLLCNSSDAADFLVKTVRENPDEIVIFAIGPTMNIARAVQQDAEFAEQVKAIYYMGGALGDACTFENIFSEQVTGIDGANVTPITEYNVLYDPGALAICLTAGFSNQYIVPGSCYADIDRVAIDTLIASSTGSGVAELWAEYYQRGLPEYPYWDPVTVYAFLHPESITVSTTEHVTVDADRSSPTFGCTQGFSEEEYKQLTSAQQVKCGLAHVIYQTTGFWDCIIELLCS